jgi:hypothetical protein
VHWAEALEQHSQRPHTPLHTLCAPDKPCLKAQPSSFPFLEEVGVGAALLQGVTDGRCAALVMKQAANPSVSGTPVGWT